MLVLFQIYLGALVAGLDAGLTFNTWPQIDGAFIPAAERLWFETPWWRNLFENALMVQFNHRMMAYLLAVVVILHAVDVLRSVDHHDAMAGALTLVALVGLQAAIGILTLVQQVPIGLALAHQAMAVVLLTIAVLHAGRLAAKPVRRANSSPRLALSVPKATPSERTAWPLLHRAANRFPCHSFGHPLPSPDGPGLPLRPHPEISQAPDARTSRSVSA